MPATKEQIRQIIADNNSKLIPKYQRNIFGIEEKVIPLYARGMNTRDIHDQIQELYVMELSVYIYGLHPLQNQGSRIYLKLRSLYRVWHNSRRLQRYPEHHCRSNETRRFWPRMLNDLKDCGVQDMLFFCVGKLPGFKEDIGAVYPDVQIQGPSCEQSRSNTGFVRHMLMGVLKPCGIF